LPIIDISWKNAIFKIYLNGLEVLGGLDGSALALLDEVDELADGVVGSSDSQSVFVELADLLVRALVEFGVDLEL